MQSQARTRPIPPPLSPFGGQGPGGLGAPLAEKRHFLYKLSLAKSEALQGIFRFYEFFVKTY